MYKRIGVALDGSDASLAASRLVLDVAARLHCGLLVCHVYGAATSNQDVHLIAVLTT